MRECNERRIFALAKLDPNLLTFSYLDLHPAANVVAGKVGSHYVEHIYGKGPECDRLLVLIVPGAAQLARMIVHLLHVWIILNDNGVFEVGSAAGVSAHSVEAILCVALGSATVDANVEVGLLLAAVLANVQALALAVVALAEDDPIEHLVELDANLHQVFLAFNLEIDNFRYIGRLQRPSAGQILLDTAGGRYDRMLGARGDGQRLVGGRWLHLLLLSLLLVVVVVVVAAVLMIGGLLLGRLAELDTV